jgi:site-specific DNA-methyltransferase (adenine-specific)
VPRRLPTANDEEVPGEPASADPSAAGPAHRAVGDVGWSLAQGDAVAWLAQLPSASVDLVVTDPPYESLEKHRAVGTTTRLKHSKSSSNDWFTVFPNARFRELFEQVHRVLKKDTHFYLFCDQETAFVAKPVGEEVGFKFWKPLVWDKAKIGMGYHYRSRYELILFFEKGKRRLNDLGSPT